MLLRMTAVSEPGAVRGPHASISRGVQDAMGSIDPVNQLARGLKQIYSLVPIAAQFGVRWLDTAFVSFELNSD